MIDPTHPELARLDLLRAFKQRVSRAAGKNVSPFADVVTTIHGPTGDVDVDGIQAEVREQIQGVIARVRAEPQSQVVLVSGDAGAGKTHLLRQFQRPEAAEANGTVFVGGSNHWKVEEFTPYLLDRLVAALTAPSPAGDNLLWGRVRAVGFRAVDQLLANRTAFRHCQARPAGGWLGRRLGRLRADPLDAARNLAARRDPAVFALLDPSRFPEYVCDRFLAEPNNPVQRYALRVLLLPLYPDAADPGVGTAERVVHWLRRRTDDGTLTRRLGVRDDLVDEYKAFDAVKLLIHLFAPDVSEELSTDAAPCEAKVFLLVFDQAEGRDELFDADSDWMTFFAHLSELYNTLPNVVALFTMTNLLRNRLHPKMERQFKDRIRADVRFVLRQPTEEQVLALYRARVERWAADDPDLLGRVRASAGDYLPLGREGVIGAAGIGPVRPTLERLDRAFLDAIEAVVNVEPEYDFRFALNELTPVAALSNDFDYTFNHLDTVRGLLAQAADWLPPAMAAVAVQVSDERADGPPVLRIGLQDADNAGAWACVFLARMRHQYAAHVPACLDLLYQKQKARYSVWMVRATTFTLESRPYTVTSRPSTIDPDNYPDQVFTRTAGNEAEVRLRAVARLLDKRAKYEAMGVWPAAQAVVWREVEASYLGELLRHAAARVAAVKASPAAADADGAAVSVGAKGGQ